MLHKKAQPKLIGTFYFLLNKAQVTPAHKHRQKTCAIRGLYKTKYYNNAYYK